MKYMKKKQKKRSPVIAVLTVVLIAAIALVLTLLLLLNKPKEEPLQVDRTETTAAAAEITEPAAVPTEVVILEPVVRDYEVVEVVDGQIQTPYGTLCYPAGLADHLLVTNTSQQPYTLEFYAVMEEKQELRLFDISLGEGSGGNMGMVTTPEGEVPLNITIYTLTMDETWAEGEIVTAYAMQDVVNELIGQMAPRTEEKQDAETVVSEQPEDGGTMNNLEIETPYGALYYPARWANTVSYVRDDDQEGVYKVHFYSRMEGRDNKLLFSIHFGGDEGEQLGAVMSGEGMPVTVNLLMPQLQLEGWDEAEIARIYGMQEAANQLIERLPLLQ